MLLSEHASIIRSKNAGPFCLTIDVFFADAESYELARSSTLLTVPGVAARIRRRRPRASRACGGTTASAAPR